MTMKTHQDNIRFVYFNSSYHASHHKDGLSPAACYAYPKDTPFTHDMAADAWSLLESSFPGVKLLQESGEEVIYLSHEASGTVQKDQGLQPKGAHLNFTLWNEKSEPIIGLHN